MCTWFDVHGVQNGKLVLFYCRDSLQVVVMRGRKLLERTCSSWGGLVSGAVMLGDESGLCLSRLPSKPLTVIIIIHRRKSIAKNRDHWNGMATNPRKHNEG